MSSSRRPRLGIIGCGSSGLVTLKIALELLPDWEVVAFEASDSVTGCWGNPYQGFASTSTRYTTQFACYPKFTANVVDGGSDDKPEFFCNGEYGDYLNEFADHFKLRDHVRLRHRVARLVRHSAWTIEFEVPENTLEQVDAVVICTGLAHHQPKLLQTPIRQLGGNALNQAIDQQQIRKQKIVVVGGGESAVDFANRLAQTELENKVFLSLHSGVRVSPRYHPVRGVPSDFLRNRLMLSAHPDVRNMLGQIFVRARIRYEHTFREWYKSRTPEKLINDDVYQRKQAWALRLTEAAKDDLFNMFHNKSDDFLEAVGDQRIQIIGPPIDGTYCQFHQFQQVEQPGDDGTEVGILDVQPDLLVPAIGFESRLATLVSPTVNLKEFYLGCIHEKHSDLFLVGFARPIIGNIPTMSEMQGQLICRILSGQVARPEAIVQRNQEDRNEIGRRHHWLDQSKVYPVEMFPYCDQLARMMKMRPIPAWWKSPLAWIRGWLQPAATLQYFPDNSAAGKFTRKCPIYMPWSLIVLILLIKPFDWVYRWFRPK